jgi:pimeloyl-ACP methyl ester carboxylesterase
VVAPQAIISRETNVKKGMTLAAAVLMPVLLVVALTQSAAASADAPAGVIGAREPISVASTDCATGTQESDAKYLICVPDGWDATDDLLVYAHGYMAPDREIEIPQDQMVIDGVSVTETVTSLGYAFATTSYSENGLAVRPAISDLLDLVDIFTTTRETPNHIYLVGVSEGGLITALSVEEYPDVYDGGLAMCGPYGDFQGQINHFGDFRVVFDYFFPGLMPGSAVTIPQNLDEEWEAGFFSDTVKGPVEASENMTKVAELLQVTGVSPYTYDPPTSTESIERLLWYNVFATEDGKEKLGGQPFENEGRQYEGSNDDTTLNNEVERFSADPETLSAISQTLRTTGNVSVPVVTLHTTGDPVVPYWHATQYTGKTIDADRSDLHAHFEVERHGHCSFRAWEIVEAFSQLVEMVSSRYRVLLPVTLRGYHTAFPESNPSRR